MRTNASCSRSYGESNVVSTEIKIKTSEIPAVFFFVSLELTSASPNALEAVSRVLWISSSHGKSTSVGLFALRETFEDEILFAEATAAALPGFVKRAESILEVVNVVFHDFVNEIKVSGVFVVFNGTKSTRKASRAYELGFK